MKPTVTRVLNSPFARNVVIVATGTAGSQAVTLAFAPIITRQYGPEALGILGTFMAMVAVMNPLASLSYANAIILPKKDSEAFGIARLSILIAIILSTLTALVVWRFGDSIIPALNLEAISPFIFLIPLMMFFATCLAVVNQWVVRHKLFKLKAKVDIAKSLIVNGANAGIGLFNPVAFVLVLVATAGSALHASMLAVSIQKTYGLTAVSIGQLAPMRALARRYSDFPLYQAPQSLINAVSQGLPIIMLASFFGAAAAGFYVLARMVMTMPATLIAQSVGEVFYPRISEAVHQGESQHRLIVKGTIGLAVLGIIPFSAVFAVGPWLFGFVFGADWMVAGEYARWLSLMLFFNFINRPSVAAVPVLGLQRGLVIYEVFSTGAKILALYIGFIIFGNDQIAVALFGILGASSYIALIAWVMVAARNSDAGTGHA